jgi:hypothetical protein
MRRAVMAMVALTLGLSSQLVPAHGAEASSYFKIIAADGRALTNIPNFEGLMIDQFSTNFGNQVDTRQQWRFVPVAGTDRMVLQSRSNTNECLTVLPGNTSVHTMGCNGSLAQQWRGPSTTADAAQFTNAQTGMVLAEGQGSVFAEPSAVQQTDVDGANQVFRVVFAVVA